VALRSPFAHEAGTPQQIEVVGEGRAGNIEGFMDLSNGHLALCPNQKEENLEPAQVSERPESLHMFLGSLKFCLGCWQLAFRLVPAFHISMSMKITKFVQHAFLHKAAISVWARIRAAETA